MPRTARASVGGICYHVLNRGNGRLRVFHKEADYAAFLKLIDDAVERLPVRVLSYCLIPSHFHLVLWPRGDGDLSRWMQWLLTAHVRRYHRQYRGSGHVWQGRFKAFPIQRDEHLLTVMRYVERNPLRAGLVKKAQDWPWSSLGAMVANQRPGWLVEGPVDRPRDWVACVNKPQTPAELEALRLSIARGRPFGSPVWTKRTAARLGIESSLCPRGRPRKQPKSVNSNERK